MTEPSASAAPPEYQGQPGLSAEAISVLSGLGTATIGTYAQGLVHLAQVWFLFEAPGLVYFESSSGTKKVRNIAATGAASVLVKGKRPDGSSLLVLGQGKARALPAAQGRPVAQRLRAKYIAPAGAGPMDRFLDGIDDIVVRVRPVRWVSWSTAQVNDQIRALPEYTEGAWDEWFRTEEGR